MPKNLDAHKLTGKSSSKAPRVAKPEHQEGHTNEHRAPKLDQQGRRDDVVSDYAEKMRGIKIEQGSKAKNGCFPKLFMMLLPFITVAAYLFLRS